MKAQLTREQIEKIYPEMKKFVPDGTTDFRRVSEVIGSRDPNIVWACVNAYKRPAARAEDAARIAKLKALMSKS